MSLHEIVGGHSFKKYPDLGGIQIPNVDDPKQVFQVCNSKTPWKVEPSTFTLSSRAGEGAYGVIYKCSLRGEVVAAKKLKDHVLVRRRCPEAMADQLKDYGAMQAYNDLVTELAVLMMIGSHPNLVEFRGACLADETNPIIFEEYVSGPNLTNFFARKSCSQTPWVPPRSVTYKWILDMMHGLEYLHNRDPVIIHRDMKPGNLLLARDLSCLKIADFGMCKMVTRGKATVSDGNAGTEAYMAPEVFHQDRATYTDKVDVYSAAVIMWYIATGQGRTLHYRGDDIKWRPDLSWVEWADLRSVISQSWVELPHERPSATQVVTQLKQLPGIPGPISPTDLGTPGCSCSVQ